jgi:hypothetical protein
MLVVPARTPSAISDTRNMAEAAASYGRPASSTHEAGLADVQHRASDPWVYSKKIVVWALRAANLDSGWHYLVRPILFAISTCGRFLAATS